MNKRIKQLADQILPSEKEWHKGDPKDWGYFFSGDELQQFAELIVRRCAAVAYSYEPIEEYASKIAQLIQDHFGVSDAT